jgi:imidazole glycerol-phosphate synthase subunit HisF
MIRARVIPCLSLLNGGLVKTRKFKSPVYVGDPINAVRIFNDKEVDEIAFLDIGATSAGMEPNYELLADIASEAFMPFSYGGGITSVEQIKRLYAIGVEKVVINSAAGSNPALISEAAKLAGNSGVVASIDVRRNWLGQYSVYTNSGRHKLKEDPVDYAKMAEELGAGEILLNSIENDGMMQGYDLDIIKRVSEAVGVPIVALGGAGDLSHFAEAVDHGASAVGAGSMFVFHGKHRAVLITYPAYDSLERLFER